MSLLLRISAASSPSPPATVASSTFPKHPRAAASSSSSPPLPRLLLIISTPLVVTLTRSRRCGKDDRCKEGAEEDEQHTVASQGVLEQRQTTLHRARRQWRSSVHGCLCLFLRCRTKILSTRI
ncbi:hypothetical protein [Oryza sativa Japonica Group]|uniref:Uncharacterized protein n=1 Tax=Oryza sativa subsp. japonica TaxID=39947 RepID=Q5JK85_ORYSJ|nr:hypothetical protein OsJ_02177 [Oryza sativa Japonica Group]BAD88054.1 hypothetical protein [Oryza sativa Japonica Group]BAD88114.1 hypothetical protein [Oryza sativa Japonica Group]